MEFNINDQEVSDRISACLTEFHRIGCIIEGLGSTNNAVPFLTRYSIISACGTVEFGYKNLIADVNLENQSTQIRNYLNKKIRLSSANPTYANMCSITKEFDLEWNRRFKEIVNDLDSSHRIKDSLESLNEARNSFAHGGLPTTSFDEVRRYFNDCIKVLEAFETAISSA